MNGKFSIYQVVFAVVYLEISVATKFPRQIDTSLHQTCLELRPQEQQTFSYNQNV